MTEQEIAETKKYSVTCPGEQCAMFVPAYSGKLCRFTGKPLGKSCGSPINKHGVLQKQRRNIAAMTAIFALSACAGPKVTDLDVEIARAQAEAQRACYAAAAIPTYADARDAALLAMARALTGDPCKQTNVYDSRAAIAAAQNQALGAAVSGAVIGVGIVAGAEVLKTALRQTGNNTNTNITGTGNSAAHYDTRANVDNRISTRGDNAPASASTPASGPDLSTPTTHLTVEAQP